ncbi:monothiol glutaredoxin-S2 [Helianthus annuus]|nr:monothiol glutaredoxin-S2 [Helianthus annuus]
MNVLQKVLFFFYKFFVREFPSFGIDLSETLMYNLLISSFGANPTVYELDEHPKGHQIDKELKGLGFKPSVPAVFKGQKLIGGANEIMALHLKGQLVPLLLGANAIWV